MAPILAFLSPVCARPSLLALDNSLRLTRHKRISVARGRRTLRASYSHDLAPQSFPDQFDDCSSVPLVKLPEYTPSLESAAGGGNIGTIDGGSGSSGGGDGTGDSGDEDDSLESALESSGRTLQDLPEDVRALPGANLLSYVTATSSPLSAFLALNWKGWARRCAADAEFPFKVLMELTVGLGLSSSGMIAARGKNILNELDFALCDIAVGAAVNFVLVYLLTPALLPAGMKPSVFSKLPANMFIAGGYSLPARTATLVYKGALFAMCGFAASMFGTAATQGLIAVRSAVTASSEPAKPLPNVFANSLGWAGFMMFSANPRYQAVAGVERALFSLAPDTVAKLGSASLRLGNNVVGGASWVWWARFIGLQPQPIDPVLSVPAEKL